MWSCSIITSWTGNGPSLKISINNRIHLVASCVVTWVRPNYMTHCMLRQIYILIHARNLRYRYQIANNGRLVLTHIMNMITLHLCSSVFVGFFCLFFFGGGLGGRLFCCFSCLFVCFLFVLCLFLKRWTWWNIGISDAANRLPTCWFLHLPTHIIAGKTHISRRKHNEISYKNLRKYIFSYVASGLVIPRICKTI